MSAIKEIKQAVLALPVKQRAQLAESLLESLPPLHDECSEAEELAEFEHRERQISSGEVQPLSESKFWKQVESRRKR
jgi:putative addiction module component (TIGR02574 family)